MKFPIYLQYDVNDCAPTCIRMICAYYGNRYSIDTVRRLCEVSRLGVSVRNVTKGLEQLGFAAKAVKITDENLDKMPLPAILYWQQRHFVVLYRVSRKKGKPCYHIANPSYGREQVDAGVIATNFLCGKQQGIAILMDPTPRFGEMKDDQGAVNTWMRFIGSLYDILIRYKCTLSLSFLFTLLAMMANWCIPILFQHIVDQGIGGRNIHIVYMLAIAQFVLFASYSLSGYISNLFATKSNFGIGLHLLSDYLKKLVRLPVAFFDTKINSDLIQLTTDQGRINSFLTNGFPSVILSVCNVIAFSFIVLYYNKWIFVISLLASMLSVLWFFVFFRRQKRLEYKNFTLASERRNKIYELVMGMREIKMNSAQNRRIKEIEQNIKDSNKLFLHTLNLNFYTYSGLSSISKLQDIFIVVVCAGFIIEGKMSIGSMLTITYLLGQISAPLLQLLRTGVELQLTKISMERITAIYDVPDENGDSKQEYCGMQGSITLKDVYFKYVGDFPFVLDGVSCDIPYGKVTAIVGPSGGGKTTLLKLLVGFYYPQQGELLLDSVPMNRFNVDGWRMKCGVVMQDGYLFSGTLLDNIALNDEEPSIEKARYAARMACIDDFIESLPMDYYTNVGNMGIELSGGQKQRILIARAIYKEPEYLFLDEATSFLDVANEKKIMENLSRFFVGRTVVIIAHRLSTIKNADNIIYIEGGKIAEHGNHEALLSLGGKYFHLIREQLIIN